MLEYFWLRHEHDEGGRKNIESVKTGVRVLKRMRARTKYRNLDLVLDTQRIVVECCGSVASERIN